VWSHIIQTIPIPSPGPVSWACWPPPRTGAGLRMLAEGRGGQGPAGRFPGLTPGPVSWRHRPAPDTGTRQRRWWDAHALTTDTIAGLLVLMITVLVVDQVVRLRQGNSKARAVAVQVAILMTQANTAAQAVSQVLAGPGDRDMAREEFRAYTMMLLAVAPTLIDASTSRNFLEQAQHLDGEMALALNWFATLPGQENSQPPGSTTRYRRSNPPRLHCSRS
jgi:hypothetical protein